jgi:hypothetical protein
MVHINSKYAYGQIGDDGRKVTQAMAVKRCLEDHPPGLTRAQISEITGIPINSVCGRVNDLMKAGDAHVTKNAKNYNSGLPNGLVTIKKQDQRAA